MQLSQRQQSEAEDNAKERMKTLEHQLAELESERVQLSEEAEEKNQKLVLLQGETKRQKLLLDDTIKGKRFSH